MHSPPNDWRPIEILLVEDNPADVDLTKEALEGAKVCNRLHVVDDGAKAMDFLRQEGAYCESPVPDLILLDLNLPKKDGRQVLAEIKADPRLAHLPVVILTTSADERDVLRAYQSHANCFITKPVSFTQFMNVVRAIEDFWLSVVRLPKPKSP